MAGVPPRTILFLHSGQDWIRGSERVLLDIAGNLPRERFRPLVWCDSPALTAACAAAGIETVNRKLPATARPWWGVEPDVIAETLSVVAAHDVALLHANTLECLPQSIRAGRSARIPVVAHLHLPTNVEERVWSGLHQANMAVGVSEFSLSWVKADGFERGPTRLIYNAVFPERLERGDAKGLRRELGIAADSFVLVTVGSLIALKDTATIVQALSRLPKKQRDVHLLVVGGGELDADLRALAASLGVGERVHFLGDRDDVGAILRDVADVLVSASRSESLGLNVLEAGYFGVPSVVSAIPAHREVIDRSGGGLLFEVGSATDLASKLEQLLDDDVGRKQLGARAKQFVHERFLPACFLAEFVGVYDQLLHLSRARLGWLHGFYFPRCYWSFGWAALSRPRGKPAREAASEAHSKS